MTMPVYARHVKNKSSLPSKKLQYLANFS